jgi:putative membrane protein
MFYMHNFGWGWWLVMSVGMVAFWALVIYGIVWLIRGGQNVQQRDEPSAESPRQILNRRLAAGEISTEEYRRLVETLDEGPPQHAKAA